MRKCPAVRVVSAVTDLVPAGSGVVEPVFSWSGGGGALRLGTRTSPLAMVQAHSVAARLEELADVRVEVIGIQTAGDRHRGHLGELGGKGVFIRISPWKLPPSGGEGNGLSASRAGKGDSPSGWIPVHAPSSETAAVLHCAS